MPLPDPREAAEESPPVPHAESTDDRSGGRQANLATAHDPSPDAVRADGGSAPPDAVIRFLRACYDAEFRATSVTNLLHKSVRHLQFMDGEEHLLSGLLNRVRVGRWAAAATIREAEIYPREKSLLYCAFPIIARVPKGPHKRRMLCAPLLIYSARLFDEPDGAFLEIDVERQQLNVSVLAELVAALTGADLDIEALIDNCPRPPFDKDAMQAIMALLTDLVPSLDALSLHWFPTLKNADFVRAVARKAHARRPVCLAACAVGLFRNSLETRGVLFELAELARAKRWSQPLEQVLRSVPVPVRPQPPGERRPCVPAILSPAQQRVAESAATATLTLVNGPPGTGKSYTIAATAIDHLSRGESVLIACRKQQSVDVIASKIVELLGPNRCTVRGGEAEHRRELKRILGQMLEGIGSDPRFGERDAERRAKQLEDQLARLDAGTLRLERSLVAHLRDEERWGRWAAESDADTWFQRIVRRWRFWWLERRLQARRPVWLRLRDYQLRLRTATEVTQQTLTTRVNARIQQNLDAHRQHLTTFLRSLRTMSSKRQRSLFAEVDPQVLFGAFPIWLTNLADISEIVPLECELFDVIIFDEATQCDIASCLPALQRARRAVVVGDPHQLRHVSFLGNERIEHVARRYGLNNDQRQTFHYRQRSFLDVVNDRIATQDHVHFLDEHFRSLPQIIAFSNETFYDGALAVMQQRPRTSAMQCVFPRWVENGKKTGGANCVEGEALIAELIGQIESRANLPAHACQTIGVLAPFRDQVDWLTEQLTERLPRAAFRRHRLQIGTAHAFQGDERDLMFLSLVVDADVHNASLRFLDSPHLFNVAVTRARHQQYVFHSARPADLPADSLTRRYLEFIHHLPTGPPAGRHLILDTFLHEVAVALQANRFHTWPQYELAGLPIDLVVERAGRTVGIDLVGWPGLFESSCDLERYRILQRAGLTLFPLAYSRWRQDRDACIEALREFVLS